MLVGRRVKQDARVLRSPGGEHHDARRLHLPLLLLVVVLDAGDRVPSALVRTRVTVLQGRTSAPAFLASAR